MKTGLTPDKDITHEVQTQVSKTSNVILKNIFEADNRIFGFLLNKIFRVLLALY
jgi:hypothetical protein